jgi:hypothetical protein
MGAMGCFADVAALAATFVYHEDVLIWSSTSCIA